MKTRHSARISNVSYAIIAFLMFFAIVLSLPGGPVRAADEQHIQVVLGKKVLHFQELAPFVTEGKSYVPLRECLQQMGYSVSYINGRINYHKGTQHGTIDMAARTLTTGEPGARPQSLDFKLIHDTTAVYVRGLSTILNQTIAWDEHSSAVLINSPYWEIATSVPVLMYHYLAPADDILDKRNDAMLPVQNFHRGMEYLHNEGYYTATLDELERFVKGDLVLPRKTVVITFDDGYQNNYIYAYPELKKYGFHGVIFPIGAHIPERTATFDPAVNTHLSMDEINKMRDVFEFHSHTFDLHQKKTINGHSRSMMLDPALLRADIPKMKKLFDTPYICYPYGDYDQQALHILRLNGYRMGFTVHQGQVRPGDDPMTLKRLTVKTSTNLAVLLGDASAAVTR